MAKIPRYRSEIWKLEDLEHTSPNRPKRVYKSIYRGYILLKVMYPELGPSFAKLYTQSWVHHFLTKNNECSELRPTISGSRVTSGYPTLCSHFYRNLTRWKRESARGSSIFRISADKRWQKQRSFHTEFNIPFAKPIAKKNVPDMAIHLLYILGTSIIFFQEFPPQPRCEERCRLVSISAISSKFLVFLKGDVIGVTKSQLFQSQ